MRQVDPDKYQRMCAKTILPPSDAWLMKLASPFVSSSSGIVNKIDLGSDSLLK